MDAVVLDTDVFSFLLKRDTRRDLYAPHVLGKQICLAFQSVAELRFWAIKRAWSPARVQALNQAMRPCVVLPYDEAMAQKWAEIRAYREAIGEPIASGDCWIAAAAVRHRIPLISHNAKHFSSIPDLMLTTTPGGRPSTGGSA